MSREDRHAGRRSSQSFDAQRQASSTAVRLGSFTGTVGLAPPSRINPIRRLLERALETGSYQPLVRPRFRDVHWGG